MTTPRVTETHRGGAHSPPLTPNTVAIKLDMLTRFHRLGAIVRYAERAERRGRCWSATCEAAQIHLERGLTALVRLEDALGTDAVARYSDRCTDLRQRAVTVGLITAHAVSVIEREAIAAADRA